MEVLDRYNTHYQRDIATNGIHLLVLGNSTFSVGGGVGLTDEIRLDDKGEAIEEILKGTCTIGNEGINIKRDKNLHSNFVYSNVDKATIASS